MFANLALVGEVTSKVEVPAPNMGYFFIRILLPKKSGANEVQRWKVIVYHQNLRKAQTEAIAGRFVHATGRPGVNIYNDKNNPERGTQVTLELRATTLSVFEAPVKGDENNG